MKLLLLVLSTFIISCIQNEIVLDCSSDNSEESSCVDEKIVNENNPIVNNDTVTITPDIPVDKIDSVPPAPEESLLCIANSVVQIGCNKLPANALSGHRNNTCNTNGSSSIISSCMVETCVPGYIIINNSCTAVVSNSTGKDLGQNWMFLGDSQTAGRANQNPSVGSHAIAFETLYASDQINARVLGVGGRHLAGHQTAYDQASSLAGLTWVHFQESGNQNKADQRTVTEYITTFENFVRGIHAKSPSAIISTETAFSFGREEQSYRNWDTYNIALKEKIVELASDGIIVYLSSVDEMIKLADAEFSPENIWFQSGQENAYHYTGLGNFIVALSLYQALGFNLTELDLDLIPTTDISSNDKLRALNLF
ncbi:MAG: SGNH/GDSL hydrolase family protein [Halobacteriovoraceae bacterium]|jgi:hypothetical protein|nr:SGNH/GDSL hydrolase family protein [Halobacteriovoraceae bacterium]